MSHNLHLSDPDAEWLKVSTLVPPPAEFTLDRVKTLRELTKPPPPSAVDDLIVEGLKVVDQEIAASEGSIKLRLFIPEHDPMLGESNATKYPVALWIFGGGFCLGGYDIDDPRLRALCVNLRMTFVAVGYRLAPEHPFPTGLEDCYTSLKWVVNNLQQLQGDLDKGFIVAGISAGATLAVVITQRSVQDPSLKERITGTVALSPGLIHPSVQPEKFKEELLSMEQNKDAPLLNRKMYTQALELYNPPDPTDPDVSPLLFPDLEGLPATYIQVCGMDPLRDEAILYERLLKEAGVRTKIDIYPGFPHAFYAWFPKLNASIRAEEDFKNGLQWLLRHGKA